MPRCLPTLAALFCFPALAVNAAAQHAEPTPLAVSAAAAPHSGVVGLVTDESGIGIHDVSILAMGATLYIVRTDEDGRFSLRLAPGPYVLRATRDGYISTYREAVYIKGDAQLKRTITMLRSDEVLDNLILASMVQPVSDIDDDREASPAEVPVTRPSDTAWRLRHLPRTALRDTALAAWQDEADAPASSSTRLRLADFNGQVDFLTTSTLPASGELPGEDWPRSVAYVVLGAPVGVHGDWSVRASLASGEASAWTVAGEYASKPHHVHAFRAGVTYSAQTLSDPEFRHSLAAIDTVRRVGGVHVSDEWSLPGGLAIESGLRVERYDYLLDPTLVSGRLGVRQNLPGRLTLVAVAAPHMVAPGADQFTPPASTGVWLPPERTFSSLEPGRALRPQRIELYEFGADAALRRGDDGVGAVNLRVRRFSEHSSHQMATIFGLDEASQVGHYYIGSPGAVAIDGWLIGLSGQFTPEVVGRIDYSTTTGEWHAASPQGALRRVARSVARQGTEQLHDLTASLDANVPLTATRVNVVLRVNSGFSRAYALTGGTAARFALEVRQQLPVQPLGRGELNVLFSARTLLHDIQDVGGYYDELLTVAPPLRLTCGLQMRF